MALTCLPAATAKAGESAALLASLLGAGLLRRGGLLLVEGDGEGQRLASTDYKRIPYQYAPGGHPLEKEFGTPTISMLTHDERFNWWDNYPPEPMPYDSFSGSISYGPEGHPDYKEEIK